MGGSGSRPRQAGVRSALPGLDEEALPRSHDEVPVPAQVRDHDLAAPDDRERAVAAVAHAPARSAHRAHAELATRPETTAGIAQQAAEHPRVARAAARLADRLVVDDPKLRDASLGRVLPDPEGPRLEV